MGKPGARRYLGSPRQRGLRFIVVGFDQGIPHAPYVFPPMAIFLVCGHTLAQPKAVFGRGEVPGGFEGVR